MNILIGQHIIREWEADDEDALVKYADNPKIASNLRDIFPSPYTKNDAKEFLSIVTASKPSTIFAIATTSEAIGGIGLTIGKDVHQLTAEIGYWLSEAYWGKGIMTLAVSATTEIAFNQFGLNRVYAEPYISNTASMRVLEKAGFQLEGRLRASVIKNGQVLDQLLYSKVREGIS
jgi:ribosomal-protein-alanine N-acetyltransferase